MEPKVEARMLQALAIEPTDHILEIGTGSGFVTACLATLGNSVVSYDIHEDFIESAGEKLAKQGSTTFTCTWAIPWAWKSFPAKAST